ncbi:hypothetical protein [uncultured Tenacibaculum sp.]|uniref:hypothetical protein n=1 Tax=uncultured Tenacibaculum sp. TaxID=174713 RepID=UPI00263029C0|nr:hypothetical protein [uncultured Tenacibaculum sp.]
MSIKLQLKTDWNNEELKAYFYIYVMNADLKESEEELSLIKTKVSESTFNKMYQVFNLDNDYESIHKIKNTLHDLNYSAHQIQLLFNEMRDIFNADDDFSVLERNIALGLKRIID